MELQSLINLLCGHGGGVGDVSEGLVDVILHLLNLFNFGLPLQPRLVILPVVAAALLKATSELSNCVHLFSKLLLVDVRDHLSVDLNRLKLLLEVGTILRTR